MTDPFRLRARLLALEVVATAGIVGWLYLVGRILGGHNQ